ncbi:hypothetical protein [Mesorhizobium sp. BR1-1-4]|uniref:hypothetical protein n=1 Tax=Mesorhizobium sp. BR1-1-4 TaxID=2876650 RepID=UPI001CC96052|nr:hypothetical protein [Mesorhizobium sp. BR1-1-4]MBZ9926798.1 hypothetical protein [Mesorhizobium sp. BR1-1-4]
MDNVTVPQPTQNPTNKLTAAMAAAAAISISGLVLKNLAPGWYDPETMMNVTPLIILVFGYLIKDRPNQ